MMARMGFVALTGATMAVSALASPVFAAGIGGKLLAHRAVYDLSLARADDGNNAPSAARGRIVYEFTGSACEGWATNFRQITELQMNEGGDRTSDLRSSSFEEADGSAFQFKSDTFLNGKEVENVDGRAQRGADGSVSVTLAKPATAKVDFAPSPVFPTVQIERIVQAAQAGDRTASIQIYDGSDTGNKVFDTLTVIGKRKDNASPDGVAADAEALKGVPRWPVSVSYFEPKKNDGPPNYILAFDLYENGVSSSLRIDYGSYALVGKMTKFETLAQKPCER